MKRTITLLLFLCLAAFAQAQTLSGTITSTGCLQVNVYNKGVVGIQVTNSGSAWSGTIQPQVIAENDPNGTTASVTVTPFNSGTAQATITANGSYQAYVSGATFFQLCGNTVTNTAAIKLTPVTLAARGSGGGAGSGNVTGPASATDNAVALFNGTGGTLLKDSTQWMIPYATDTGSANSVVITVPGLPTSITTGTCVRFVAAASSTGATTITVTPSGQSAYAAKNLMKRTTGGVAALGASGDMVTGGMYEACYDGTEYVLMTSSSTTYTGGTLTSGSFLRGNGNNQVQGTGGIAATGTTVFTTYNSETLAGVGVPFMRGQTLQKAETGSADTNVLTVTTPATAGTYLACATISVASATSGVISWTLSWTDSNGNAQSNIAMPLFQFGTAAPNTTFTTSSAGNYSGCSTIDTNNGAASIIVKWVGGGTTSAKMSAHVERIGV